MLNWRWYLFWIKDYLQGGYIYNAYKELKQGNNDNQEKIKNLLNYARENTKFYSKINSSDIKDFPIINKLIINENYDDFKSKKYEGKSLHKMSTSGSTGIPFTVFQNKEKRKRVLAELLFYNTDCGYQFGKKQIFFRIWTNKNKKTRLQRFIQNLVPKDISNLDETTLKKLSEELKNDRKIHNILSYASTLEQLSDFMIRNNYKSDYFSINSIISSSEVLQDKTRDNLKKIFKCNIVSRYSTQEMGVIAQEYVESKNMQLNNTNYHIEFLKLDSDDDAEEGEISRVIVTDLYNYAMPLIRYDTGDLAVYSILSKKEERVITQIYGRRIDLIYDTQHKIVSPHAISVNMWGIKGVKQFKFQQVDEKQYKIILNMDKDKKVDEKQIIKTFLALLGKDAIINIEYVDEIPILASGKRKYIENISRKIK